uniref:Uncharacterized protein n=1 Tax=Salix viminalis TaxID=40686 RepID=A0A6N2ME54_SALVM
MKSKSDTWTCPPHHKQQQLDEKDAFPASNPYDKKLGEVMDEEGEMGMRDGHEGAVRGGDENHVSNGRLEQALRSVVWMQQESYRPDVVTAAIFVLAWKGDSCFCCQEPVLAYRESFAMRLSITEKPPVW